MNNRSLAVADRMQNPVRMMAVGLLLACNALAVRAQPKAPEAAPPMEPAVTAATTQPATSIDLSLPAAAPQPATSIDLSLPAATTQPATSIDLSLPAAAPRPAIPTGPASPAAATQPATPINLALPPAAAVPGPVDLLASASDEVKRVARWVIDSGDNTRLPFVLIDKVNAQVFVFSPSGQLQGSAPALLGLARGDRMLVSNDAPMSAMAPSVRITPAGRFVSRLAKDSKGKELLVLDYNASLSLHPVVKGNPKDRRAERLSSATSQDNRVSFGCINVPVPFYSTVVSRAFTDTKGIVYVLPETGPASALFGMQPVGTAVSGTAQGAPASSTPAAPTFVPVPDAR